MEELDQHLSEAFFVVGIPKLLGDLVGGAGGQLQGLVVGELLYVF